MRNHQLKRAESTKRESHMNNTSTSQSGSFLTIKDVFARQAESTPHHIAIRDHHRDLTYQQLNEKARQLAGLLQERGVRQDTLVAISGERSSDYLTGMLAVVIAGGAYLPIDPTLPASRLKLILDDAKPALILAAQSELSRFEGQETTVIGLEEAAWLPLSQGAVLADVGGSPDDLLYVMYTSGSTGIPKGVCIVQRGVLRLVCGAEYATFGPEIKILQNSPLSFDASTFEIWGSLLNGGTCVLMPHKKPSLRQMEDVLIQEEITTLFLTTALFVELAERAPYALRKVKELLTGGEAIPAAMVRRALTLNPELNLIACYGPTECTTFTSTHRYRSAEQVGDTIPLGEPIAQTELYLLKEDRSPADIGEEGELYVGGAGLARCYLNRPDLTSESFVSHPYSHNTEARLYRTGDQCVLGKDGSLLFKGRRDRQIKLRGFRIELGEIEATINRYPTVQSAVVKTEETAKGDRAVVAYLVPTAAAVAPDPEHDEANFAERTREWQQVYSKLLYKSLASSDLAGNDPTFNTSGWKSSFDGRHMSNEVMEEQVGETVKRIRELSPRNILEIGCGTGLLLFRLAPYCRSYVGTDFSPDALNYVQERLGSRPGLQNVTLLHSMAHELPEPPEDEFDVVVINSVSEHFVSLDYLERLLTGVVPVVRPGGYIFVGDNRSYPLLPLFHASVQAAKSAGTLPVRNYSLTAEQAASDEQQLTIDPYFFAQLDRTQFRRISLQLKRGRFHNELTGYRFDATLQVGGDGQPHPIANARQWQTGADSLFSVKQILETQRPEQFALTRLPNRRLRGGHVLLDALAGRNSLGTVGEIRRAAEAANPGEDPEYFWQLGEDLGYDAQILPSRDSASGEFDVVFRRQPTSLLDVTEVYGPAQAKPLETMANDPLLSWRKEQLASELRKSLERELPEYAVPSFFVVLPRFPLTENGKIDMAALPKPARLSGTDASCAQEGSPLEQQIRAVWGAILGVRNISLDEKFFEIGGDSLKAVRVASELSGQLNSDISPALLFEQPTIRGLAARLTEDTSAKPLSDGERSSTRGAARRMAARNRHAGAVA